MNVIASPDQLGQRIRQIQDANVSQLVKVDLQSAMSIKCSYRCLDDRPHRSFSVLFDAEPAKIVTSGDYGVLVFEEASSNVIQKFVAEPCLGLNIIQNVGNTASPAVVTYLKDSGALKVLNLDNFEEPISLINKEYAREVEQIAQEWAKKTGTQMIKHLKGNHSKETVKVRYLDEIKTEF